MTPRTMRAAIAEKVGEPLIVREIAVPEPGAGQILVRIVASGVCHTDIHGINGDWPLKPRFPIIPGHEACGYVVAAGPGVRAPKEGDRVGISWLNGTCGDCEYCLTTRENLCLGQQNSGYSVNGTFAEYALVAADYAIQLPSGDLEKFAPILCAGLTTYRGLKETGAKRGETVLISGVGGIGHLAVQYAKAMGFHVVAIDIDDEKLAQACALGADMAINAAKEFPINRVKRAFGGVHGALITAVAPDAFRQGIAMLRRGGTCVLVGIPPGTFPFSIFDTVTKGLTIRGSIVGTRQDVHEALQFVDDGKVAAVIERRPLEQVNDVIAEIQTGRIKARAVLCMS